MNAKLLLLGALSLSSCFVVNDLLGGRDCQPACTAEGNVLLCNSQGDYTLLACALEEGESCREATFTCGDCGDGVLATGETCDDGNTTPDDGCSAVCQLESDCGNGLQEPPEQCDDGNNTEDDGCNTRCTTPQCGNSITDQGETCDDGDTDNGDGCSEDCQEEQPSVCGNSIVEPGEACDDGNQNNGDACEANCTEPFCGNLINDLNEDCDDGNQNNNDGCSEDCLFEVCGDSIVQDNEQCDDGNQINTDACNNACFVVGCGDGLIQSGEACDDANTTSGDGCSSSCQLEICGDGILQGGEQCDDGASNSDALANACRTDCQLFSCKDGTVDFNEQCDNNTASCNAQCQITTRQEIENNDTQTEADDNAAALPITDATRISGTRQGADIFQINLPQATFTRVEIFDNTGADCGGVANPGLSIFDDSGLPLDFNENDGINLCPALVLELPAGISYVQLEKDDFNNNNYQYILEIIPLADVGDEVEPNGTITIADPVLGLNAFIFGALPNTSDTDFYEIFLPTNGLSVRAEIIEGDDGLTCESDLIDSRIALLNDQGTEISFNDDATTFCSLIDGTGSTPKNTGASNLPAGTYFIKVEDSPFFAGGDIFQYRLAVTVR